MTTMYNGYRVDESGTIYSKRFPDRPCFTQPNHKGYLLVGLMIDGAMHKKAVHSVIAECFLGPRPEGYQIDHINGDKTDNRAANLRYVTPSENVKAAYALGLKDHSGFKASASKYTAEQLEKALELIAVGRKAGEVELFTGVKRGTYKLLKNGSHFYLEQKYG